jgi:hypothetical protein
MIHGSVKYGNETLQLKGSTNRFAAQDAALYQRPCTQNVYSCMALDELYAAMIENAHELLATPLNALNDKLFAYVQIQELITGALDSRIEASVDAFYAEIEPVYENALLAENILLGVLLPTIFAATVLLLYFIRRTRLTVDTVRSLLQMLPYEYIGSAIFTQC